MWSAPAKKVNIINTLKVKSVRSRENRFVSTFKSSTATPTSMITYEVFSEHFTCSYLHDRRLQCRLTGHSRRRSQWLFPHSDPGSGRESRSCCSGPGTRVGLLGWPLPSPPGPKSRRSAAESGCSPESPSVWRRCLLQAKKQIYTTLSTLCALHRQTGTTQPDNLPNCHQYFSYATLLMEPTQIKRLKQLIISTKTFYKQRRSIHCVERCKL